MSRYLSLFSPSFNFTLLSAETAKSTIQQVLWVFFFLFVVDYYLVVWPRLGDPFVFQNPREFCTSRSLLVVENPSWRTRLAKFFFFFFFFFFFLLLLLLLLLLFNFQFYFQFFTMLFHVFTQEKVVIIWILCIYTFCCFWGGIFFSPIDSNPPKEMSSSVKCSFCITYRLGLQSILLMCLPISFLAIIIIIFIAWEFFTSTLADCLSVEFEWQQVSSSLQDSSQYSDRSQ